MSDNEDTAVARMAIRVGAILVNFGHLADRPPAGFDHQNIYANLNRQRFAMFDYLSEQVGKATAEELIKLQNQALRFYQTDKVEIAALLTLIVDLAEIVGDDEDKFLPTLMKLLEIWSRNKRNKAAGPAKSPEEMIADQQRVAAVMEEWTAKMTGKR